MCKLRKILLAILVCIISMNVNAQRIRSEKIVYYYHRLPMQPLDKKFKNYSVKIDAPYEAKNEQLKKNYEQDKLAAAQKYSKDSVDYEAQVKVAYTKYEKELEEYNKKNLGLKIIEKSVLGENTRPVMQTIPKPYPQTLNPPILQTTYNHALLADTYMKLYGFNNDNENSIQVNLTLFGFDFTHPRVVSVQRDETRIVNRSTSTAKVTYYSSEFSYRHPMAIKVKLPDGKEILNVTPQELNVYQVYKTPQTTNYQTQNSELLIKSREEIVLQDNLTFLADMLNDKYGFSPVKRVGEIFFVKEKGSEYADLTTAFNEASSGLQMLKDDSAGAKIKLQKAIGIWNTALKESDPSNRKARIDKDVTMMIIFNILETQFAAGDVASGEATIEKLNAINMDSSDRKTKMAYELAFIDLKKRQQQQK